MPCQAGTLHHHPLTLISDMSAPPPPPPRRNSWRVYERVGLRNSLLCLTNTTRFLSLFHFAVVFTHCCTSLRTRISSRRNVLPSERSRTAAEELLPRRETLISSIAAHSNSFASPLFFARSAAATPLGHTEQSGSRTHTRLRKNGGSQRNSRTSTNQDCG